MNPELGKTVTDTGKALSDLGPKGLGDCTRRSAAAESPSSDREALDEARRDVLDLQVVLQRAVVAAGEDQQALGLVRGLVQLLADRVGHLLVALGVQQEQRRVARPATADGVDVSRPPSHGSADGVEREVAEAGRSAPAQQQVGRRGADRHHRGDGGSSAAAWIAVNPPMLEPRRATLGACSRSRSHMASASPNAVGPHSPAERPWPRAS